MSSGTVAKRVKNPTNSNVPHTISTTPTNGAMICGEGIPIFAKHLTPKESWNGNFCMPSERNTQPTSTRISKIALEAVLAHEAPLFKAIGRSPQEIRGTPRDRGYGIAFRHSRTES